MLGLIVRRVLIMVPMLLVVSFLVFGLVVLIPGDAAQTIAGGADARPENVVRVREELHLDDPFLTQYGRWLGDVVQLDFGRSLVSDSSIADEIRTRAPITLGLVLLTLLLAVPVAVVLGVIGGLRPGGLLDRVILAGSSLSMSLPSFWVALLLVTVFAIRLGWLPPFGYTPFTEDPGEWFRRMILPATSLALTVAAVLARQVRAGLADTMQTSFVRTAWAKGGNTRQVVGLHALKPSAMPAVTVLGLQFGALLGGTVLIERIFTIPGLGAYLLSAVSTQDLPVIQAAAMLFVVTHVVASLVVDVTYGFLNPKVRTS